MRVGRNPDDKIPVEGGSIFETAPSRDAHRLLLGLIEIATVLNQVARTMPLKSIDAVRQKLKEAAGQSDPELDMSSD